MAVSEWGRRWDKGCVGTRCRPISRPSSSSVKTSRLMSPIKVRGKNRLPAVYWSVILLLFFVFGFLSSLSVCRDAHKCNRARKCCSVSSASSSREKFHLLSFHKLRFLSGLLINKMPQEITNKLFSVNSPVAWSWSMLLVRVMSRLPNSEGSGDRIGLERFAERF